MKNIVYYSIQIQMYLNWSFEKQRQCPASQKCTIIMTSGFFVFSAYCVGVPPTRNNLVIGCKWFNREII